ncbi:MAG: hypothetical protein K2Q12_11010 [Rickettsiales bacterium]|nr:hypothetical protein [Rickettsiales bacterium]
MSTAGQNIEISRFDFGALRDFAHPYKAHESISVVEEPTIVVEAPPPPPTYSQEQLDRTIAEAMERGRMRGIEEGRAQVTNEQTARVDATQLASTAMLQQLQQAQTLYASQLEERKKNVSTLALAVAKHVCHTALKYYPATLFDSLVARCMPILLRQPRLIIIVHPELLEIIEETMRQMRLESGYEGHIEVRANHTLGLHDAKLHWEDGHAEVSADEIWRSIENILQENQGQSYPTHASEPLPAPSTDHSTS